MANEWVIFKSDAAEKIEQDVTEAYQKILDVFNPQNRAGYKELLRKEFFVI